MASKRGIRRREARHCRRKRAYDTEDEAWWVINARLDDPRSAIDPDVAPYRCAACGKFHLGHSRGDAHKTSHDARDRRAITRRRRLYR